MEERKMVREGWSGRPDLEIEEATPPVLYRHVW